MPHNPESEELREIHTEALERFNRVWTVENDQRTKANVDIAFAQVEESQWDDLAKSRRKNRPRYEINKIALAVSQVVGDQRQNRISVKVRPAGGQSTKDVADVYNGLIRNIENISNFVNVRDNAFKESANGGMGAWYVTHEFTDDDSFEQDLRIKTIRSAINSVWYDPAATDENKRDASWCFVTVDMDKDIFKEKWPDAVVADMSIRNDNVLVTGWSRDNVVRVADYWRKEDVTREIALMTDGRVLELTKDTRKVLDELKAKGITIAKTEQGNERIRKVKTKKIVFYKMSGAEILDGPREWPGKFIPVVPVYGYNTWINGKHFFRGMVRFAKDAQRIYNYITSAKIEAAALSPKDPIWVTPKQIQGHTDAIQNFNLSNTPFMQYNEDPKSPGPPKRTGAPAVQSALIEQAAQADIDIQATTGKFSPSLGDNPKDQSGRAILAVQRQGDAGTFELVDNLAKAVQYTGEILVDLVPRVYDNERQIRIIQEDGETEMVFINQTVTDEQSKKKVILNDLSQGKYDVVVDVGPSFQTQRLETLNFLRELAESSPVFAQIAPDLLAKMVDFPGADELSKRARKIMIAQGVVEPTEEEKKEMKPPQPSPEELELTEQALTKVRLENEQLAGQVDKLEIENDGAKIENDLKRAEVAKRLSEVADIRTETVATAKEAGIPVQLTPDMVEASAQSIEEMTKDLAEQDATNVVQLLPDAELTANQLNESMV